MNIFILDRDFKTNVQFYVDRHVTKMGIEACGLLSNALYLNYPQEYTRLRMEDKVYAPTHMYHPCTKWTAESFANFKWLIELGEHIFYEYYYRYDKPYGSHKSHEVLNTIRRFVQDHPKMFETGTLSKFVLAMPDKYKQEDPIEAYRAYYIGEKQHLAHWKKREIPEWWK